MVMVISVEPREITGIELMKNSSRISAVHSSLPRNRPGSVTLLVELKELQFLFFCGFRHNETPVLDLLQQTGVSSTLRRFFFFQREIMIVKLLYTDKGPEDYALSIITLSSARKDMS